jgi:protein-S-isoprenylcysteine O-methyltransferase Ste14
MATPNHTRISTILTDVTAVLVGAARSYDMRRFLGLAQLGGDVADEEPFRADGMLGYVRHPLYLGSILLLAGLVRDSVSAQTAVFATLYFVIGLRFEERALLRRFGAVYGAYRAAVPALVPWRGRAWPVGG